MNTQPAAGYPQLFRQMIVRSTEAALAAIDPKALKLEEEERERSLYALGLALDLPEAWLVVRELLITISPEMIWQGYIGEWVAFLKKGVDAAKSQSDLDALAKLQVQIGRLYRRLNQFDHAKEYSLHAYNLAIQQNDKDIQIDALDLLSAIAVDISDLPTARMYADEILRLADATDPRHALRCSRLGFIAIQQAQWDEAIYWYSESVRLHTLADKHRFAAQSKRFQAYAYTFSGKYQQAVAHYKEALRIFEEHPSILDVAMTQMELGVAYWFLKDYEQALAMYNLCEPVFVNAQSKISLSHLYNNYGLAHMRTGDFKQSERCFSVSIELGRELSMPRLVANALDSLAQMFKEMGLLDKAIAAWEQGLAEITVLPEPPQHLYNNIVRRIQEAKVIQGEPGAGFP